MNSTPPNVAGRTQRKRAFALLAVAMLTVLFLLGYERWLSYVDAIHEAETKTFNYAAIVEARLDATLRRVDGLLQNLEFEIHAEAMDPKAAPLFARDLNAHLDRELVNFAEVSGLRVFGADGERLYASGRDYSQRINIADRDYFQRARNDPTVGLIFSSVLSLRSTGRQSIIAARPVRDAQGAFRALVVAAIDLDSYEKLFQTLDLGANGVMVIRRSDDFKTVVRWPVLASEVNRALPPGNPVRDAMVAGKPRGTLPFAASSDGVVRTYSYRSVAGYPFFILSALAHNDVLAGWRKQSLAIGIVAAMLLVLLTGLLRYLWRIAEREARLTAGLREGEERLRLATAAGGIGLYDLNVQTGKAVVNAEYASMLGYDPANFEESNQAWVARLHPDDTAHTFARYSDYIAGISPTYQVEFRQRTADGQYKWIQSQGSLVESDAQGRPLRMLGTHVDIAQRKQTETALRALNLRLDFLLSSSPITLYTCEAAPPYTTTFISRNVTAMLGYEPDDFLNTPDFWDDRLHPDDKERVAAGWPALFARGHLLREYRFRHHDGSWRLMEESVRLVRNETGDATELIGYLLDVTERRNTQQNLLVKQAAMDSALNAIAMTGMDRVTTYVNRAFLDMWKLERPGQVIGRLPREFIPDAAKLTEMILRHGQWQGEMLGQRADGSTIDLQVSAHLVKNENGEPVCMMASFVDISVRKKAEEALHNLNVELESRVQERTAKLETANAELETFTYTVSHDLRAPLRAIDGFSNLLLQDYHESLDETGKKFLHNVRKSAQQMGTLIDDLLAYAKFERRDVSVNPLSPREVVEQLLAEYEDEIKSNGIAVTVGIDCETVRADRDALAMALRNLIGNALKFSRGAARPEVAIGSSETASACRLWVRDNGIGFDMKYHEHIFTIFKRLERGEKYPGTGVGLAIVKKAMERIGGRAWAESEPGKGATFYLEIPK